MAERRYKAFISYSHRDKRIANWLHHALETYRLPDQAAESKGREGLRPIFKDRDELPAADNLGEAIEQAIRASDALIVLCSPGAAQSPWIAREIDLYKRLNGDRGIFPVIVEGEPPDNFPAPLLVHYENGEATDTASEPIAADIRPEGDGRKLAKLKLIAGLAHLDLDSLVQRDAARRQKRLAMVAAASLVGMAGTSGLALYAIDQRNEAREQRAEADGLIEYMLTDLRKQLEPVGRLEVLDGVGKRAMDYYARQKLKDLSDTELGRRARATMLVAEVQNVRGNNEEALPAFEQAARTTQALLERKPDDPDRMFNHGQSLFWVGYIAWQHGRKSEARRAMEGYAAISSRLAAKDRTNLQWQKEEAYSLSNLGTLSFEEGKIGKALTYFRKSADAIDAISRAEGRPIEQELELADAYSWIASTLEQSGKLAASMEERRREVDLLEALAIQDPANNIVRRRMVGAKSAMGRLQAWTGRTDLALATLNEAVAEGGRQVSIEPDDTFALSLYMVSLLTRGKLYWSTGRTRLASQDYDRYDALLSKLAALDPENRDWNIVEDLALDVTRALTDRSDERPSVHRSLAAEVRQNLASTDVEFERMMVAAHYLEGVGWERDGQPANARKAFTSALAIKAPAGETVDIPAIALRRAAASKIGESERARELRDILRKTGATTAVERWVGISR